MKLHDIDNVALPEGAALPRPREDVWADALWFDDLYRRYAARADYVLYGDRVAFPGEPLTRDQLAAVQILFRHFVETWLAAGWTDVAQPEFVQGAATDGFRTMLGWRVRAPAP